MLNKRLQRNNRKWTCFEFGFAIIKLRFKVECYSLKRTTLWTIQYGYTYKVVCIFIAYLTIFDIIIVSLWLFHVNNE